MHRIRLNFIHFSIVFAFLSGSMGVAAAPLETDQTAARTTVGVGAAVLVGLRRGISLRSGPQGVGSSDTSLAQTLSALGVKAAGVVFRGVRGEGWVTVTGVASPIDLRTVYRLRLPAGTDVTTAVATLSANLAVVYAEPDAIAHLITPPQ